MAWASNVTEHMEQVNPGEWSWFVTWQEDGVDRRVPLRPRKTDEVVCGLKTLGCTCVRRTGHPGLHVPVGDGMAQMGMILDP